MNRNHQLPALCLLVAFLAAACSSPAAPTPTAPQPTSPLSLSSTPVGTSTPAPTDGSSPTPRPTSTETPTIPPSATPSPSLEPTPVTVIDPGRITWAQTRALPIASSAPFDDFRGQQLVFHNGFVYVFGGWAAGNNTLQNVYYSAIGPGGALEAWQSTTPLPAPILDHVAVKVGSFVYLLTGAAGQDAVYYALLLADGSVGGWMNTARLSPSRQNFAAVSYGNFIYATGGNSGGNLDFVQYTSVRPDGSLNEWAFTTPLPEGVQAHTMVAYRGYLYVFGGKDSNDERVNTVYYAAIQPEGDLGAWLPTTVLPGKVEGYSTFESNGTVYLLGGNVGAVYYSQIQDDFTLGAWTLGTPLPAASLHGLRVGAYNGFAYAAGGLRPAGFVDTVYFGAIGSGIAGVTSTPTLTPTPGPGTAPAVTPTTTPAGDACALTAGQLVQVAAGANLWSEPDVATGSPVGKTVEGVAYYVLSGPVWGRVQAGGAAGWWWELSTAEGGGGVGWIWEGRIAGCG